MHRDSARKRATRATLVEVLDAILRLLHPIMPFITEEIWQRLPATHRNGASIMLAPFPAADPALEDADAVAAIEWVQGVILGIRRIRGEMDLSPSKPLPVLLADTSRADALYAIEFQPWLKFLARIDTLTVLGPNDHTPDAAVALVGRMKVLVPMAGLIDKHAELERLGKQIDKLTKELDRARAKLANDSFVNNAPPTVVEQERGRVAEFEAALGELSRQRDRIAAL